MRPLVGRFLPLKEGWAESSRAYFLKKPRRAQPNTALFFFARACSMFSIQRAGTNRIGRFGAACLRAFRRFQLPGVGRQDGEEL